MFENVTLVIEPRHVPFTLIALAAVSFGGFERMILVLPALLMAAALSLCRPQAPATPPTSSPRNKPRTKLKRKGRHREPV